MSAQPTRAVTLKDAAGVEVTVDIRIASQATATLRTKVSNFIQQSFAIWKEQPVEDTVLLATPAVLDGVIQCATAFHANEQGTVDLVWVKKDMPREALKDEDVGYWRGAAGPGPRLEQLEMQLVRDIPAVVMDDINQNNNHDMIAHFLYAFIDFWCIVLKHWIIWLACIFWYGYLCILCPTIIVGESSKLFNIIRYHAPHLFFHKDLTEDEFNAFLNGQFDFAFLQHLVVGIKEREWDEYEMPPSDYIHAIGIPIIQAYGPFARHVAIYIPKMDPYAPYHMQSVRQDMIEVDRYVRLMIELAHDIVLQASPIPFDDTRKACLTEVRSRILQEASRIGLLSELNAAKAQLALANKGFWGSISTASNARLAEQVASGSRESSNALKGRPPKFCAEGAKESDKRKKWVVDQINELRDQLESGLCIGLLACPHQFEHGTLEHAQWLYLDSHEGSDIINSASGFTHRGWTSPEDDMRLTALSDLTSAACILPDTHTIKALDALKILALSPKERESNTIYLVVCPYCAERWLVNDGAGHAVHDCVEIRKQYLPGLKAHLEAKKAMQAQKQADEADPGLALLQKKSGVTRCIAPVAFEWTLGERITGDEEIFNASAKKKKKPTRRPGQTAEDWERAIDDRGRISAYSLERHRIAHSWQLLQLPEAAGLTRMVESPAPQEALVQTSESSMPQTQLIPVDGYTIGSIVDVMAKLELKMSLSGEDAQKASNSWLIWKEDSEPTVTDDSTMTVPDTSKSSVPLKSKAVETEHTKLTKKMLGDAIKAWIKDEQPALKAATFTLEAIMSAAEKRTSINRLRPHHFDPDTMEDLLPVFKARIASSSSSATVSSASSNNA